MPLNSHIIGHNDRLSYRQRLLLCGLDLFNFLGSCLALKLKFLLGNGFIFRSLYQLLKLCHLVLVAAKQLHRQRITDA
jgi:hypothetical protein